MGSGIGPPTHPAFPDGQPVKVGRRFILVPGNPPVGTIDRIPIQLSRGRAFGSGLHETTISCVESLEKLAPLNDLSVLDVGTGTGILSLAAVKLGARYSVAFDIDRDAAFCCYRNAVLNRLDRQIGVFNGTLDGLNPLAGFDLVLANIHGDIIHRETERLVRHIRVKGHLILSGLDFGDNRSVKEAMKGLGMGEVAVDFLDEFVTQVWHRPPHDYQTRL